MTEYQFFGILFFGFILLLILFAFILAVLMLFTHQKNIERLLSGEESKFHFKKKDKHKSPPSVNS